MKEDWHDTKRENHQIKRMIPLSSLFCGCVYPAEFEGFIETMVPDVFDDRQEEGDTAALSIVRRTVKTTATIQKTTAKNDEASGLLD